MMRAMTGTGGASEYLFTGHGTELDRLRLQATVWDDAGRHLLSRLPRGEGARVIDVGCGALGWLPILSEWVGPRGEVVGTDVEQRLLEAARSFCAEHGLDNVRVVRDDVFASRLDPASFDLVHARFMLAPIGRLREQLEAYRSLAAPEGWIALEDPDASTWHFNPAAPGAERLIELVVEAYRAGGGNFDAGRRLPQLLRTIGVKPSVAAHVIALAGGHPYLRLPLQFATSLEPRLLEVVRESELETLRRQAENELADPNRWGTTFTLIQAWGQVA